GIAELAALHGHDVTLRDVKEEFLDRGMERIRWSLGKLVDKNQIGRSQMEDALGRIHVTLDLAHACRGADIAIEAVFEDVDLKKDVPGFITTRVLGPYFEEAAWIHDTEGIAIETIDAAMRFRAGFPMGPFELADQVGIDVLHHLIKNANRPVPRSVQTLI